MKTAISKKLVLGVDTGGTFTDFVLIRNGQIAIHKVLSTPDAPERAILQGITDLGISSEDYSNLTLIHGSTVATNAVLEGKGVRTAYITNRGFGDLLSIGRQARGELYNLQPQLKQPPLAANACLETGGRISADGKTLEPLTQADIDTLLTQLKTLKPDAVAINLLFSFLDECFEKQIEQAIPDELFSSRSSQILPEYKEYERGITTWLNAYVGPLVEGYLKRLGDALPGSAVSVMQSSGNTIEASQAGRTAVNMLLSGPAGGLSGAKTIGEMCGAHNLLTFDMGGTSTDVSLIQGELKLTSEGRIGDYPVSVPMVDMHTIGAGGGSIAWIDEGGLLQVGPQSAGASPGPACYGKGGSLPTVTDANLVLGRLQPQAFLGGEMILDYQKAVEAIEPIASVLDCSVIAAAEGIIRIANEHMVRALRVMSIQRGIDPKSTTLVSFGGAGGLHVCALANALGIRRSMVPIHAGVLSALGMLTAPRGRQLSHTLNCLLSAIEPKQLEVEYSRLFGQAQPAMQMEGVDISSLHALRSLDLRYQGQSYTLNITWADNESIAEVTKQFHQTHLQHYGHELSLPVELVNIRLQVTSQNEPMVWDQFSTKPVPQPHLVTLTDRLVEAEHFERSELAVGYIVEGPAIITETVATTFIEDGWIAELDSHGNLRLNQ